MKNEYKDNLTRCAVAAVNMHMTYGKYMAYMHEKHLAENRERAKGRKVRETRKESDC